MPSLSELSQGFLTAGIILYISVFVYAMYYDWHRNNDLKMKHHIIGKYHDNIQTNNLDVKDVEVIVRGILEKRDHEKSLFAKLINAGKNGVFYGGLSGAITGGAVGSLTMGIVFGLISPVVVFLNEISNVPEELSTALENKENLDIKKKLGHFAHLPPY